ncbi:hypothetical protein LTR02_012514 [Friedmanniomyces endolithicus]|nr:hypothetical protein LTR94_008666 [Friedmanniomyces endolithicus]KAK0775818.1 hypothetical protein LTR59_014405 [Friedmanniomyces endolithicus]KAK0795540.1 hypothetical protein LTR38_008869 [Friedmanniomyces endolithicus]KAK0817709.1 hypothetical protein LTR75_003044 [Friedmanniomyces endolithicus]KAK0835415.1 hypothetical protein LTR03_013940 [Friedmanniomyces endolithicus]
MPPGDLTTFDAVYAHLTTAYPYPVLPFPSPNPHSKTLSHTIASLSVHPTLEALLHILNADLASAHFLCRHMQNEPAWEGMYIHGFLHRVEGDYRNADAWYGNVAESECFRRAWPGQEGLEDAKAFIRRVERLRKQKIGDMKDLEVEMSVNFPDTSSQRCTSEIPTIKMLPTQPKHEARELTAKAQARATRERISELEVIIRTEVNEMRAACGEAAHLMPPGLKVTVEVEQGPGSERPSRAAVTREMSSKPAETLRRKRPAANEPGKYPGPATLTRAAVAGDAVGNPVDLTENDAPEPKRRRTRQHPPTPFVQYQAPAAAPANTPAAFFSTAQTWPQAGPAAHTGAYGRFQGAEIPVSLSETAPGMMATAAMPAMRRRAPLPQASAWSSGGSAAPAGAYGRFGIVETQQTAAPFPGLVARQPPFMAYPPPPSPQRCAYNVQRQRALRTQPTGTYPRQRSMSSFGYQQSQRVSAPFPSFSHAPSGPYEDLVGTTGAFGQFHITEMPASPFAFGPSQQPPLVGPLPPSPQYYDFGAQLQNFPRAQPLRAYHGDQMQQPFTPPLPLSSQYAGYDMQPQFSPGASFPPMGFAESISFPPAQAQSQGRPDRRGSQQGAGSAEWYQYVPENLQDAGSGGRNTGRAPGVWRSDAENGSRGQSGANERSGSRYGL